VSYFRRFPSFDGFERNEEILPQLRFGHAQALGRMCGLTMHDAQSLIRDGELDILSLIHQFSDAGDHGGHYWQGFRQHALCLCMLSHFLLASGFNGPSVRLIEVAQGLKAGKSCMAMTLAETLMGLVAFHRRQTTRFAGSPLLLQVMFPPFLTHILLTSLDPQAQFFSQNPFSLFSHHTPLYSLISHFSSLPRCG